MNFLRFSLVMVVLGLTSGMAHAETRFEQEKAAIKAMTGCFLVDYSYAETKGLKAGYTLRSDVYDVNRNKAVKEWIYASESAPNKIRLQHILFSQDPENGVGQFLKHQADDWEYAPKAAYKFISPSYWEPYPIEESAGESQWVRKITNLDDGLRHQCVAAWKLDGIYPEWSCSNLSPIPGRESRDMKRKDYQALARTTRLIVYGNSYLERQDNVKLIYSEAALKDGSHFEPLATEVGKNWYVRLPESECQAARDWMAPRVAFWALLQETWDEILDGKSAFREVTPTGQPPRFVAMMMLEETAAPRMSDSSDARAAVKTEIQKIINQYRVSN